MVVGVSTAVVDNVVIGVSIVVVGEVVLDVVSTIAFTIGDAAAVDDVATKFKLASTNENIS
jgi:hypothetical protein